MENIWGFLLQTLSVSLVAVVLLLIKRIFEDKLSPRWQYGIWTLLAVRILLPVGVKRYIILPLPLWIETMKTWVEGMLTSAYAHPHEGIAVRYILPWIQESPLSVTDGLFVVYTLGVGIVLLWYAMAYLRLRLLLRKGSPADAVLEAQIQAVAKEYGLSYCPAVTLYGLSSAFVCGVMRPVLVVPAGTRPDDKVILHELLHLKHKDAIQSVFWCVLRALHWCNPFMQYIFYRIVGDMESLCDQRVLERLEGEERRQYGGILLNMANEKYASMPGTTSISNGGKNISRRIEAIVRFKKYPKGMALVSVCIAVILVTPMLWGSTSAYGAELYEPGPRRELSQAMAVSRLNRCTTVAGALDTYAKGLILENGIYIATASSLSRQAELAERMDQASREEGWAAYHLESGPEFDYIDSRAGYSIWNLEEKSDGSYSALLAFPIKYFPGTESEEKYWADLQESKYPENVTLVVLVTVDYEDAWVVEEMEERICSNQLYRNCDDGEHFGQKYRSAIPFLQKLSGEGKTGSAWIGRRVCYRVAGTGYVFDFFGTSSIPDLTPKVNAEFDTITVWSLMEYTHDQEKVPQGPLRSYQCNVLTESADHAWIEKLSDYRANLQQYPWDGVVRGWNYHEVEVSELGDYVLPSTCKMELIWDGQPVDEILLQEE